MSFTEAAAILFSALLADPGEGLHITLQLEPFQCSISVCEGSVPFWKLPTAQMLSEETAAIPVRPPVDPGVGLEMTVQFREFPLTRAMVEITPTSVTTSSAATMTFRLLGLIESCKRFMSSP